MGCNKYFFVSIFSSIFLNFITKLQGKEGKKQLAVNQTFSGRHRIIFQDRGLNFPISCVWLKSIKSLFQCQHQDSPDKWNYARKVFSSLLNPFSVLLTSTNEIKMLSLGISEIFSIRTRKTPGTLCTYSLWWQGFDGLSMAGYIHD